MSGADLSAVSHAIGEQLRVPTSQSRAPRRKPLLFATVLVFIVILVYEETVYGRLGLSSNAYLIAKTSTEAFLYLFLLFLVAQHALTRRLQRYVPTLFDYAIVVFLALALLSTMINNSSLLLGALNIRTMLRYVAIYYIIILSNWTPGERQVKTLFRYIVLIAITQAAIISIQHWAGDAFQEAYFSPPDAEIETQGAIKILGATETKLGAGYGTFGKTALAAFYLLLGSVVASATAMTEKGTRRNMWWLAYLLILIGIYFTYKRAALLLALLAPVLIAWQAGDRRWVKRYVLIGAIAAPGLIAAIMFFQPEDYIKEKETEITPAESFAQLFSADYWAISSSKARGWVIMEVGGDVLTSFKPIGYGADKEAAKAQLAVKGGEFAKLVGWGAMDDVYLVAALVYYGPIGVGILTMAFVYIYRKGRSLTLSPIPSYRLLAICLTTLLILMLLAVFVVRVLEFRAFAFTFWAVAGMVVAASRHPPSLAYQASGDHAPRALA